MAWHGNPIRESSSYSFFLVALMSADTVFQNFEGLFGAAGSGYPEFLSTLFVT
jgi:hypothetical protein